MVEAARRALAAGGTRVTLRVSRPLAPALLTVGALAGVGFGLAAIRGTLTSGNIQMH